MKKPVRILYLEDSPEDAELVGDLLNREYLPCELSWVNGRQAFLSALRDNWNYDLLLVDYSLPDIGGDEALEKAKELAPDLPFVFLAGSLGEERAVECLRQGATDYVLKTNLPRLAPVIRRALEEARQALARKEAEASHARVASLLRATLDSTAEGILVVDLAGRISAYNRKFLSLCGIPEFVMAPMAMDEVIQFLGGQLGDPGALLEEARLLRSRSDKESSGVLALQGNRLLEESGRPHKVGGETVGRVLSFREPRSREPISELFKTMGTGRQGFRDATMAARVVPWYLQGDRLVMPEAAEAVLGLAAPPQDLEALVDALHPEDADLFMEALELGRNVCFKARLRKADGAWSWTRWSVDRGPDGHRGVIQEIGEEERLTERILRRKRVEGARDLARRMTGTFRDHLGGALAGLRSVQAVPGQERPLGDAIRSLSRAGDALDGLWAFANLGRPARVPLDPDRFLEDLLDKLKAAAPAGVRINFNPARGLPQVALDPLQMSQTLAALVANAGEAMGSTGNVHIATALLAPRDHRPGAGPGPRKSRVIIEVGDTGPGIPPAIQDQVFEPFFSTRAEAGHAGMGLTLVQEIVEAHGGSIQLDSAPGRGTIMRLLLPVDGESPFARPLD